MFFVVYIKARHIQTLNNNNRDHNCCTIEAHHWNNYKCFTYTIYNIGICLFIRMNFGKGSGKNIIEFVFSHPVKSSIIYVTIYFSHVRLQLIY